MKKRFFISAVIAILLSVFLVGCSDSTKQNEDALEVSNFKPIEEAEIVDGKNYLAYNEETKVVYYWFSTSIWYGQGLSKSNNVYFAPYISENGRFCRYVDGEIVEIIPESTSD